MSAKRFLLTLLVVKAAYLSQASFWNGEEEEKVEGRKVAESAPQASSSSSSGPVEYGVDMVRYVFTAMNSRRAFCNSRDLLAILLQRFLSLPNHLSQNKQT